VDDNSRLQSLYEERLQVLEAVAAAIRHRLREVLCDFPRIDLVLSRIKSVASFVQKANKVHGDSGKRLYEYPLEEIQDQIGTRVIVYYRSDVQAVANAILSDFREIEDRVVEKPDPTSFGYEARHFVCLIPPDISAEFSPPIECFELQVSTLFQHAWAQANHDLGYKPLAPLEFRESRAIAWAAAQAWGADEIFDGLWRQRHLSQTGHG